MGTVNEPATCPTRRLGSTLDGSKREFRCVFHAELQNTQKIVCFSSHLERSPAIGIAITAVYVNAARDRESSGENITVLHESFYIARVSTRVSRPREASHKDVQRKGR